MRKRMAFLRSFSRSFGENCYCTQAVSGGRSAHSETNIEKMTPNRLYLVEGAKHRKGGRKFDLHHYQAGIRIIIRRNYERAGLAYFDQRRDVVHRTSQFCRVSVKSHPSVASDLLYMLRCCTSETYLGNSWVPCKPWPVRYDFEDSTSL
jgi:hypothetical protein